MNFNLQYSARPLICEPALGEECELHRIDTECNRPPWSVELFKSEILSPLARLFCLKVEGRMVAFLDAHIVKDQAHIVCFGVEPKMRRNGFGKTLLAHLLACCAELEVKVVTLEVRRSNLAALALYQTFGFSQAGIRTRYYSDDGEDAVVMLRSLSPQNFIRAPSGYDLQKTYPTDSL